MEVSDKQLLKTEAEIAMMDPYYMATRVLGVGDGELPRDENELRPIYDWFDKPRPAHLNKLDRWFRFWSAPRFTAKTYILLVYLFCRIIRNPDLCVAYQSQEKNMAMEGGELIKSWFERPEVTRLYGEFKSNRWDVEKGLVISQRSRSQKDPTFRCLGLDNPLQGKRVDIMAFDDMVGETNNTEEGLKKVEHRFDTSLPLVKPGGEIIKECTRWNPFDMSSSGNTLTDRPGIIRQFELSRDTGKPCMWDCPEPRGFFGAYAVEGDEKFFPHAVPGEPLFPSVLPESVIDEYRSGVDPQVFASQILNEPISAEMRRFDPADFQYFDTYIDGKLNPLLVGAVPFMAVDPASARHTKSSTDDSTFCVGYIKWQEKTFNVYIVEWRGGRWSTQRVQATFMDLYDKWRPRMIYPEINTGGDWFLDPIRNIAKERGIYLPIHDVFSSLHGTGKKVQRIQGIETYYHQRRVYHDTKLKNGKGEMQLLQFTGNENKGHDDFADVLAHLIHEATKKRWGARESGTRQPPRAFGRERRYAGL